MMELITEQEAVQRLLKWLPKRATEPQWQEIKTVYTAWKECWGNYTDGHSGIYHFSQYSCHGRLFKHHPCVCLTIRDDGMVEWREHLPFQFDHEKGEPK